MPLALITGAGAGLSLIVAIGAQNAFVLRQGLLRQHTTWVVALCAISDAILIAAGVAGVGVLIDSAPAVLTIVRFAGAAFLLGYATLAARRAWSKNSLSVDRASTVTSLGATIATCLALTWLNPHVYLDTVVLLGSIANSHPDPQRWLLGVGAVLASIVWFTALGYGARLLSGWFARPIAWRILDSLIAVTMTALAIMLIVSGTG